MAANRERVQLLVDALRSGEFQQGQCRLNRNETLCCLGVACEVAIRHGVTVRREEYSDSYDRWVEYDGEIAYPPSSVTAWFGFTDNDPMLFSPTGEPSRATWMNDERDYSFAQIADAFERTFLAEAE